MINNVETLANLPPILSRGAEWYRTIGTEKSPGPKIFCLSGHIARPGNYELPLGTTFRELIYTHGGGIPGGHRLKAIMPAGASSSILAASDAVLDTPMDYESVAALGSALGSASLILMDETVDMSLGRPQDDRVLHARIVRQVHPVPRGNLLDAAPDRTTDGREPPAGRRGAAGLRRPRHTGQVPVRAG